MRLTPSRRATLSFSVIFALGTGSRVASADPGLAHVDAEYEHAVAAARAVLDPIIEESGIPGFSASISIGGQIIWSEPWGMCSIEHGVATTRETRFRYASVSKVFTAALAVQLAEDGVIDLDADVRSYVPEFPDHGHIITIRQLLGHLGGIRHYIPRDQDFSQPGGHIDLRLYQSTTEALALFKDDPLEAPPGQEYHYSTFAFTLIAAALEGATDTPFLELIETWVAEPLGLDTLAGDEIFKIVPNRTTYYHSWAPGNIGIAPPSNLAYKMAGGGIIGSTDDLARFGAAHLEPGFIEASLHEQMFTSQATNSGEETGIGLTWRIKENPNLGPVWHHSGNMAGTRSTLVLAPNHDLSVALVSNLSNTPRQIAPLGEQLAEIFVAHVTDAGK